MWQAFVNLIADALLFINQFLDTMGLPYSFGFAIILFTFLIKLLTLPLTLKQLQSTKAMQELQPEIAKLQKKYKDDKEKLSKAQMDLYKERGVNPLSGCLPTLIQMPIWFALYRALFDLAQNNKLSEGFLWIPSLAEPHDMSWIWPLPTTPDGWLNVAALLVLPILTVVTQLVVQKMTTPPSSNTDSQQAMMGQMMTLMPIMFGFFALQVPQGLVLYWVTSNLFMMVQQYFITRPTPTPVASMTSGEAEPIPAPAVMDDPPPDTSKRKRDGRQKSKR